MSVLSSFCIIILAALIHASFQLSVSVLTLLTGHAVGSQKSLRRITSLTSSFVAGTGIITILLLGFIALLIMDIGRSIPLLFLWAIACGIMIGIGIAVWAFYYRRERGTSLWIPRGVAHYLSDRTKATRQSAEAFSLGIMSVIGELLFIIAPLFAAALVLVELPSHWQLIGIILYGVISLLPLISVWALLGSGHKLSEIQRWREKNKYFLQFVSGAGLVVLGAFIYVYQILGVVVGGA